jgi:dTMP kinase
MSWIYRANASPIGKTRKKRKEEPGNFFFRNEATTFFRINNNLRKAAKNEPIRWVHSMCMCSRSQFPAAPIGINACRLTRRDVSMRGNAKLRTGIKVRSTSASLERIHLRGHTRQNLKHRGRFITLEGIDGTGKSTQYRRLVAHLRKSGYHVCATREPGGTAVGEQIRRILLRRNDRARHEARHAAPGPLAELALMYAARAQHLEKVVRPALERGEIVVSDRFNDASFAYQGYGRKLGAELVKTFDRLVCGRTQPDLTLLFDLDPRAALRRARGRDAHRSQGHSRFEAEGIGFQERVRAGYLAIARQNPGRVRVIRADRPADAVAREVKAIVETFLSRRAPRQQKKPELK